MRTLTLALVTLLLLARPAAAQFDSGAIVGAVRDGSGGAVAGATITLTNTATGVSAVRTTDALGQYELPAARIGTYLVTAEKQGFAVALADNVQLTVGARVRVDLELQVGQLSEKIAVTAGQSRQPQRQRVRDDHADLRPAADSAGRQGELLRSGGSSRSGRSSGSGRSTCSTNSAAKIARCSAFLLASRLLPLQCLFRPRPPSASCR